MASHTLSAGIFRFYGSFSGSEETVVFNEATTGQAFENASRHVVIYNLGAQDIFASFDNTVTTANGSGSTLGGEYIVPANTSRAFIAINTGTPTAPVYTVRMTPRSGTGNYGVEFS